MERSKRAWVTLNLNVLRKTQPPGIIMAKSRLFCFFSWNVKLRVCSCSCAGTGVPCQYCCLWLPWPLQGGVPGLALTTPKYLLLDFVQAVFEAGPYRISLLEWLLSRDLSPWAGSFHTPLGLAIDWVHCACCRNCLEGPLWGYKCMTSMDLAPCPVLPLVELM